MRGRVVDHQQGFSAVHFRIGGLAEDLGVGGVNLAVKCAVLVELLRLVPEH